MACDASLLGVIILCVCLALTVKEAEDGKIFFEIFELFELCKQISIWAKLVKKSSKTSKNDKIIFATQKLFVPWW